MAKKISQLTQATQVKSDDVTVIVQDGETKKLPLNMMVTKQDIENKKVAGLAKLDEIEATYENDTYTPTITVKNKSSVKVGEGDEVDYSANVMDGHAKSAILTGNTLVNLANYSDATVNINSKYVQIGSLVYSVIGKPITLINFNDKAVTFQLIANGSFKQTVSINANSKTVITLSDGEEIKNIRGTQANGWTIDETSLNELKMGLMVIEGDYTNVDIPYFEGMQSVKMPVLCTTGKNLFQVTFEQGSIYGVEGKPVHSTTRARNIDFIKLTKGNTYTFSVDSSQENSNIMFREFLTYSTNDYNSFKVGNLGTYKKQFTYTPTEDEYIKFVLINNTTPEGVVDINEVKIQIEYGMQATPYESYKTNILTTNEEVELRGIGDVKDELDLLTGELTQRIGEIVLNGSEGVWDKHTGLSTDEYDVYWTSNSFIPSNGKKAICDKLSYSNPTTANTFRVNDSGGVFIGVSKGVNITNYLSQNTPKIQYDLSQSIIKTVDLMPSGTHPSTTPYCWKNGHIQLSSSGLLPNLEYSVVTSRAGQINQNATMIVKNDKRIFDLEILLAGGLVNTTYQALTLQNQVETGLSKVSLNSETEPDYLLYHMIMKLIEEKAYKLDDLTEKVSVFYLYEKLSDEQFETIYSALYPFVEDEIVEEPVVEELPEVVEDEVIM